MTEFTETISSIFCTKSPICTLISLLLQVLKITPSVEKKKEMFEQGNISVEHCFHKLDLIIQYIYWLH